MEQIRDAFAYDAWANGRLARVMASVSESELARQADGDAWSALTIAEHLATAHTGFGMVLAGEDRMPHFAKGRAEVLDAFAALPARWDSLLASGALADPAREVVLPWFGRAFRLDVVVHQLFLHGQEHRSDLAAALTRLGHPPGDMEYIQWVADGRPPA